MQSDLSTVPPDDAPVEHRLQFTGTGGEYFRIWIVNLLFSILTFGIYSAWAKVRREQYFHRNTLLDGSGFDYHGDPKAILKGRIIAVALLFILSLVERMAHDFYYPVVLVASPLVPWLMIRSFIFRSRNTSFRSLHFDFRGTYKGLCKAYLVPFIVFIALAWAMVYALGMISMELMASKIGMPGIVCERYPYIACDARHIIMNALLWGSLLGVFLLVPVLLYRFKAFQFNHLAFGASRFESRFKLRSFYGIYLRVFVLTPFLVGLVFTPILIGLSVLAGITSAQPPTAATTSVMPVVIFLAGLLYITILVVFPAWFAALLTNLVWNNTCLGRHSFKSDQTFWGVFRIVVGNLLLMLITLGLYWPWAKVKIARYRIEHAALLAVGSLDDFVAGATREKSAIGEEVADIFDFDIAF
ncbi:MAG: DUF898 domain-containing protein [Azoarcus sp.]|jgi:uncharacterized membrane protein YjgN (DUF898 family)|nr:DUF898 domain-containing protein [Azoarcus sp.]